MKKSLVITLFLVLSSFFFISIKEVKAEAFYKVNISNFDFYNDNFLEFKRKTEGYLSSTDYTYYNIYYYYNANYYYACYFNSGMGFSTSLVAELKEGYCTKDFTSFLKERVVTYFSGNIYYYPRYIVNSNYYPKFSSSYVYIYNDFSYEMPGGSTFIFPYDFYLKYQENIVPPDPHKSEKQIIANFYTICIDKLGYLGEQIVSNYVYLSMIVVLILVFIIELIRRWLM